MSSVLIIDDDRLVIEQLTELISSFGHEVAFVPKPSFALQRLEKDHFNLILIDVNMPEINGIELLKRIKANDAWSTIPVIMMTGEGDNDTLAAMVSNLIDADLMVILTNQKGLYDKNPDILACTLRLHLDSTASRLLNYGSMQPRLQVVARLYRHLRLAPLQCSHR